MTEVCPTFFGSFSILLFPGILYDLTPSEPSGHRGAGSPAHTGIEKHFAGLKIKKYAFL